MKIIPPEQIGRYLREAERYGVLPIFYLELTSGLRRGELLALRWDDVDVATGIITVNKQVTRINGALVVSDPKTNNSIRKVAVPQRTVELLVQEHNLHPDSPYLFMSPRTGGMWSPDSVSRIHKELLAKVGMDTCIRFHDLRHTFATLAMQNGVDPKTLSDMLGHSSAAFTLDTYTHVTHQMQQAAAEKMDHFTRLSKRLLKRAEIDERVSFHDLRHTFATLAIQNGVDPKTLSSMLGHYSAAFTLDTYTHVTHQMQRAAAEKIGDLMEETMVPVPEASASDNRDRIIVFQRR